MIDKIRSYKNELQLFILYIVFLSLNLPHFHISAFTLPAALYIIYLNKNLIKIDKRLMYIFYLLLGYLVLFSMFSIDYRLSAKGSFDVLKTVIVFLGAIVFFLKIDDFKKLKVVFLIICLLYLLGNFFFDRGTHFNYYENPNSGAINILLVVTVSLFLYEYKNKLNNILTILILITSLFLIFYSNSRGVVLSIFVGIVFLSFVYSSARIKIYMLTISTMLFLIFIFFLNSKGLGLSNREEIWLPLINYTIENNLFFGNGINTTKVVIKIVDSFTHIAHNMFVEIFSASGLLGLLFMGYIFYLVYKYFYSFTYKKNIYLYIGLFNITTLIVLFQIDMKFYAYPYLGLIMVSLGALYISRDKYKKER